MKKLLVIFILLTISMPAIADGLDDSFNIWDAANIKDNAFQGQKPVTDEQFDKTIEAIKEKQRNKKKWFWEKKKPEIKPLSPIPQFGDAKEFAEMDGVSQKIEHAPTIMISTNVYTNYNEEIPCGYYKLSCEKNEEGTYDLVLSQGNSSTYKIEALAVDTDDSTNELNYGNAIPYNDQFIKLIYGNLDINLEAYLRIKN